MGENLDVNDQPLSGSHVTLTHDLNGQKNQQNCARKSTNFSKGRSGQALEKLIVSQLVKKFLAFYGTRSFITVSTSSCHLFVP
jgi:hypothetical protein